VVVVDVVDVVIVVVVVAVEESGQKDWKCLVWWSLKTLLRR